MWNSKIYRVSWVKVGIRSPDLFEPATDQNLLAFNRWTVTGANK